MSWRNNSNGWGFVAIGLHWSIALVVFGMFGLGLYMTELTLYDPWYHKAPNLHRSIGVLLFLGLLLRLSWRLLSPPPAPLASHRPWERRLAHAVHIALYLLLFALMTSGYLITTADGQPVYVFSWFSVPATLTGEHQEDTAGIIHTVLAWTVIALALLHAAAALKHHFIDGDRTLVRMLGMKTPTPRKGVK